MVLGTCDILIELRVFRSLHRLEFCFIRNFWYLRENSNLEIFFLDSYSQKLELNLKMILIVFLYNFVKLR